MNLDNFIVRPKRRLVEKYAQARGVGDAALSDRGRARARGRRPAVGLVAEDEEAKRFDLLILKLQLAVAARRAGSSGCSEQVKAIAGLLEEKTSIPMVQQQLALIQESRPTSGGRT